MRCKALLTESDQMEPGSQRLNYATIEHILTVLLTVENEMNHFACDMIGVSKVF